MPEVSVIIPCYNTGKYLTEAIDSVLRQTYQDFEIIVVDDGSTDNTRQVTDTYSDQRVHYVYQQNLGLSAARNTGIRQCSGSFVMFLDADDLILPTKLTRQTDLLTSNAGHGVVFSDFRYFLDGEPEVLLAHDLDPSDHDVLSRLVAGNFLAVHTALLRRSCFDRIGLFCEDLTAVEDWDLWLRMAYAGIRFFYHAEPLALYRRRANSMASNRLNQRRNEIRVLMRFREYVDEATLARVHWSQHAAYRHIVCALVLYQEGQMEEAREKLAMAASLDRNWVTHPKQIVELVAYHAQQEEGSRATAIGPAYVDLVFDDLARIVPELDRLRNRAKALSFAADAFVSYTAGKPHRVRANALKAMRFDRGWLSNRGLASILLQSLIGREIWHRLHRGSRL